MLTISTTQKLKISIHNMTLKKVKMRSHDLDYKEEIFAMR